MTKSTNDASKKLQGHSVARRNLRVPSVAALLVSLLLPHFASAAIMIDPGALGDSFINRSYDVTSEVRAAGVTNANGTVKVLDFIFSELKALRVNGDGLNITAKLETVWNSNPSGIGGGFSLFFGDANSVVWTDDSATLFVDSNPGEFTTPPFTTPPNDFDIPVRS